MMTDDSNTPHGPQVGDRVKITLTGTVRVRRDGKYPSVEIELDDDLVSAGTICPDCDDYVSNCEDGTHRDARSRVLTFADPAEVVMIERSAPKL